MKRPQVGMTEEAKTRFESLYRTHARDVHAYCLRRTSREEAKDATSEVFVTAWRRIDGVPSGDEALPWLYGVARKTLANRARSSRRRKRLLAKASGLAEGNAPGPEPQLVQRETAREVSRALATLSEQDQEVLRLVEWEGVSRRQVATMLFVSRAAIDKRLTRAYRKMARELGVTVSDERTTPVTLEEGGEA